MNKEIQVRFVWLLSSTLFLSIPFPKRKVSAACFMLHEANPDRRKKIYLRKAIKIQMASNRTQQGVNVKKTLPLERKQAHACWMGVFLPDSLLLAFHCLCCALWQHESGHFIHLQATPKMLTASLVLQLYLGNSNLIFPLGWHYLLKLFLKEIMSPSKIKKKTTTHTQKEKSLTVQKAETVDYRWWTFVTAPCSEPFPHQMAEDISELPCLPNAAFSHLVFWTEWENWNKLVGPISDPADTSFSSPTVSLVENHPTLCRT